MENSTILNNNNNKLEWGGRAIVQRGICINAYSPDKIKWDRKSHPMIEIEESIDLSKPKQKLF